MHVHHARLLLKPPNLICAGGMGCAMALGLCRAQHHPYHPACCESTPHTLRKWYDNKSIGSVWLSMGAAWPS